MRGINTAIIDEADSVLIDEAVTPLIISQPQRKAVLESDKWLSQALSFAAPDIAFQ